MSAGTEEAQRPIKGMRVMRSRWANRLTAPLVLKYLQALSKRSEAARRSGNVGQDIFRWTANLSVVRSGSVASAKFFPAIDAGRQQDYKNFARARDALPSKRLWIFKATQAVVVASYF
ncbi:hypothetical protein [Xanthomonas oryzae]|uniref:hypothetical protein n=1 Tax=Xanthomonas oryzae TaxID=347 RepID=UPI003DA197A0